MTREELFNLYEVFINTDAITVELMNSTIDEYARSHGLRFTDVLSGLYEEMWGPDIDIDFDVHPPHPDEVSWVSPPVDFGEIPF